MSEGLKDDLNNKIAVPLAEDDFSDIDDYEDPNLAVDGANLWDVTACNTNDSNNNDDDAYIPAELKENKSDCKVLVIGATNSGKTSLIEKFLTGKNSEARTTFGIDISKAKMPLKAAADKLPQQPDGVNILIYDMAGMRKFQTHNSSYYSNVFAALFVFDVTCKISLNFTINWLEDYSSFCKRAKISPPLKALVCNKSDLLNPAMNRQEITELAQESGMTCVFECSAKTGRNVDFIFSHIAEQFIKFRLEASQNT